MYVLDDGKELELCIDGGSRFTPGSYFSEALERIKEAARPLTIRIHGAYKPALRELAFVRAAIDTARRAGRPVHISKKSA